jgi:AraC-like DNA-binding protein
MLERADALQLGARQQILDVAQRQWVSHVHLTTEKHQFHSTSHTGSANAAAQAASAIPSSSGCLRSPLTRKQCSLNARRRRLVTSAARTLGGTLPLYERYCRIVNEAVRVKPLRIQNGLIVEINFVGLSRHHFRQNVEFVLAANLKGMRENVGRNIRPIGVTFAHPRNSNLPEFERFFGCPVEYGSESDQWSFSNETLAVPLISGDPYLLETLKPFCDQAARERNTAVGTLRSSVENEAQKLLPHGKANRQTVARALGMSERTLSRRLAGEGTTYDELVDQLRRSLAFQYIKAPSVSVSQIAWLLGYEGSTSFSHAFVRWTGRSPSAARKEEQLPAVA